MPELAEVEIVRRGLENSLKDGLVYVAKVYDEKFKEARLAGGCWFRSIKREGKFIVITLQSSQNQDWWYDMIISLGMTGSLTISDEKIPVDTTNGNQWHLHVQLCMKDKDGNNKWLLYKDPRKFGSIRVVKPGDREGLIAKLGPDPLDPDFGSSEVMSYQVNLLSKRSKPIKAVLLNQEFAAGIGNYLADEILFRCNIHPLTRASKLTLDDVANLNEQTWETVEEALEYGGNTFSDYVNTDGESGNYFGQMWVYGREGQDCKYAACFKRIQKIEVAGRGTHFCPGCQPLRK